MGVEINNMSYCYVCKTITNNTGEKYRYTTKEFKDYFPSLKVCVCPNCDLFQLDMENNDETNSKLMEYYSKYYRVGRIKPTLDNKKNGFYIRGREIKKLIVEYSDLSKNDAIKVYEKGCGLGFNLMMIKDAFPNAELYSDEMDSYSEKNLKELGVNMTTTDMGSMKYDIIIISHVLEHLLNPLETIELAYNHLKDNSYLYIEIPNNLRFEEPHVTFWTVDTIRRFVEERFQSRFEIIKLETRGIPEIVDGIALVKYLKCLLYKCVRVIVPTYKQLNLKFRNGNAIRLLLKKTYGENNSKNNN